MTLEQRIEAIVHKLWHTQIDGGDAARRVVDNQTQLLLECAEGRRTVALLYKGKRIAVLDGSDGCAADTLRLSARGLSGKTVARRMFGVADTRLVRVGWHETDGGGCFKVLDDWYGKYLPPLYADSRTLAVDLDSRKAKYID